MTLNMLRRLRINPKMSAYTQLFGMFDYIRTPLAPLGTKAFVHERTTQRRSHANHEYPNGIQMYPNVIQMASKWHPNGIQMTSK